jgi:MoaA/NifB/PqqE/SkfB family radical SAM enzyme
MGSLLPFGLRLQSATVRSFLRRKWHYTVESVKNSTPKKINNFLAIQVQKLLRTSRVRGLPYRYTIDPVNLCNLNCPLCPTGTGNLAQPQGRMRLEDFKRIVDEIEDYAYTMDLFNWGEPFLHRDIFEMIRYATSRGIRVRISTNLNVFNEKMAEEIIKAELSDLIISLDGPNQAIYQEYRVGGRLDRVIRNLELLVEKRKQLKSRRPFITVLSVVTQKNEEHISEVKSLAERTGADAFSASPVYVNSDNQHDVETWLPLREGNRVALLENDEAHSRKVWDCLTDLWGTCTISWEGGVVPCCWVHDSAHEFGNVLESSLRDVWNNELYMNSRRVFQLAGRDHASPETICTQCRGHPKYRY